MSTFTTRYELQGCSATKNELHGIVDHLDKGLFPGAFADGSGTKSLIAYLHYKETGDLSVFNGIAQDSIVMNVDDLACVGLTDNIVLASTINRNPRRVGGDILKALIEGTESYLAQLRGLGLKIYSGGGETADVPDLTSTFTIDSTAFGSLSRTDVVNASRIRDGLAIVGLASYGQSTYEKVYNSGIGSNGLTGARHELLHKYYAEKYPECLDVGVRPGEVFYAGQYRLSDPLLGSNLTIGEALLSPTRTYAPVIKAVLDAMRSEIYGIIHCSGGGQTKCLRFGHGVSYVKDNLFNTPPLFRCIQESSGLSLREMFQVYNMGHRIELYVEESLADEVIQIANSFRIDAQIIGHTENSLEHKNKLEIWFNQEMLVY